MFVVLANGYLTWKISGRRLRFLFFPLNALSLRMILFSISFAMVMRLKKECDTELAKVGTEANFTPVAEVASAGVYEWSRNPMYIALSMAPLSFACLTDCGWFLLLSPVCPIYLDSIVIPAEEKFLMKQLGEPYTKYMDLTPRWIEVGGIKI
mmetsp:Transcript_44464/g.69538  ORF Transcript_44464/g.69538 Transcript_44464/m.69538 type:complete len:152 (-) Transcript_44464:210-665(-)